MEVTFWGTAAAEGIPGLFCNCEACRKARAEGGRAQRGRSQVLIDDALLVDFNADTWRNSQKYKFDMSRLGHVLLTHVHEDHFYPSELHNRKVGFSHDMTYDTLTFYGTGGMADAFHAFTGGGQYLLDEKRVALVVMEPFVPYDVNGYEVVALPATHGTYRPVVFLIARDGKRLLYGNDCGPFGENVWNYLADKKPRIDCVLYDCTMGDMDCLTQWGKDAGHGGLSDNMREKERLTALGLTDEKTIHIVTHFSHNAAGYASGELQKKAKAAGFSVSYDGWKVSL